MYKCIYLKNHRFAVYSYYDYFKEHVTVGNGNPNAFKFDYKIF